MFTSVHIIAIVLARSLVSATYPAPRDKGLLPYALGQIFKRVDYTSPSSSEPIPVATATAAGIDIQGVMHLQQSIASTTQAPPAVNTMPVTDKSEISNIRSDQSILILQVKTNCQAHCLECAGTCSGAEAHCEQLCTPTYGFISTEAFYQAVSDEAQCFFGPRWCDLVNTHTTSTKKHGH